MANRTFIDWAVGRQGQLEVLYPHKCKGKKKKITPFLLRFLLATAWNWKHMYGMDHEECSPSKQKQ